MEQSTIIKGSSIKDWLTSEKGLPVSGSVPTINMSTRAHRFIKLDFYNFRKLVKRKHRLSEIIGVRTI